jgi:L-threonylcarbamoyladenylate synthase
VEIEAIIGPVALAGPVENRPQAPGQLKHHYAPRKPLRLVDSVLKIPARADVGWLAFGPGVVKDFDFTGVKNNLSPRGEMREAAANLFRAMRALDDDPRVSEIYAMPLPAWGLGLAINERLDRAAG